MALVATRSRSAVAGPQGVAEHPPDRYHEVTDFRLLPVTKDAFGGPYQQLQLVRIYILVGEPEKALDQLEPLLRIDPTFDPLRKNPRFQKLMNGSA
jgi:hypothetical protein